VLFQSGEKNSDKLTKKIEKRLAADLGYEVKVILRTDKELESIVANDPFKEKQFEGKTQVYVAFLSERPVAAMKKKLSAMDTDDEMLRLHNREVYVLRRMIPDVRPRFSNNFLEKEVGQTATSRNWATVNKLLNLAAK